MGLIGVKCLVGGVCAGFIFLAVRATAEEAPIWVPVYLLAISTVARYFLFRPQLFTFALFALCTAVLIRYLVGRRTTLLVLPFATLVWANLHGGFLAGLAVIGLALLLRLCQNVNARDPRRRLLANTGLLAVTLVASGLSTFANPSGVQLWRYVLTEVTHDTNRRYIAEWRPLLSGGDGWSAAAMILIVVLLVAAGLVASRYRTLIHGLHAWQWVASCLPLGLMAFVSVRHVPLAAIWIAPVIALLAAHCPPSQRRARPRNWGWQLATAAAVTPAVLTCIAVGYQPWPRIDIRGTTLGRTHPCTAVAFLREHGVSGNVYNPLPWGGYLTWHLYPSVRVSMDGRNISIFPRHLVLENLLFYKGQYGTEGVEVPLQYDTDLLLVPADSAVLAAVVTDSRWQRVFSDAQSSLFVRAGSALAGRLHTTAPAARLRPLDSCPDWLR
jgi:hypothetical protein